MKPKIIMNIKSIITATIALLVSTACSGGAKQEKVMAKDGNKGSLPYCKCHKWLQHLRSRGAHREEKG
ncbi:hypothetical protein [Segatella bryantii]|uniref:hypothetical protein n=1 Tax=Segatella bryantii TaxID=77095 RepID=UPI001C409137|nr:hypothetical protein [Segatella bryantii]